MPVPAIRASVENAGVAITPYDELTDLGKARRHRITVQRALALYDLRAAHISQLAVHTNFVFRVTTHDGRRFALRVSRNGLHDSRRTDLELWWISRLAADGLPVAAAVANADGALVTSVPATEDVPEPHRCVLFEWLPGRDCDDGPLPFWSAVGELTAQLHVHAAGLAPPAGLPAPRWDSVFAYEEPVLFAARFESVITPSLRVVLERGIEELDTRLARRYLGGTEPRLLHGDLHDGNVRSHRGRLSVFDFEDVIVGYPAHDLAVLLYGPYYNREDLADIARATRDGYERVAPWPIDDVSDLADLFAARALGLVNFCVTMGPEYHDYVNVLTGRVERFLLG